MYKAILKGGESLDRHSSVKWETMREALLDTTIPYVISLIVFLVTFFRGADAIGQNVPLFTFLVLVMTVFVLWTDYKILVHMNSIKGRKSGIAYLLIVSLYVLSFQVFYDMMLSAPPTTWHFLWFDGMYNLSFCALFIVAFKFAAIFFIDFFDQIEDAE